MIYTLDTDTCVAVLRNKSPQAEQHIATYFTDITITSVVVAELLFGAEKSAQPARNRAVVERFLSPLRLVVFDRASAGMYAIIRTDLEQKGQVIGGNDLLIAATALAHGMTLVTHNTGEFARIPNLLREDWLAMGR